MQLNKQRRNIFSDRDEREKCISKKNYQVLVNWCTFWWMMEWSNNVKLESQIEFFEMSREISTYFLCYNVINDRRYFTLFSSSSRFKKKVHLRVGSFVLSFVSATPSSSLLFECRVCRSCKNVVPLSALFPSLLQCPSMAT